MAVLVVYVDSNDLDIEVVIDYPDGIKPVNGDLIDVNRFFTESELERARNTDGWDQNYIKLREVHLDKNNKLGIHWCAFANLANA